LDKKSGIEEQKMSILQIPNVSKSYGKHQILSDIELSAETGKIHD